MVFTVVGSSPISVIEIKNFLVYFYRNRNGCVTEWFNVPGLSLGVLFRTRSSNLLASVPLFIKTYNLNTCIFIGDSTLSTTIGCISSNLLASVRSKTIVLLFYIIFYNGDSSLSANLRFVEVQISSHAHINNKYYYI